MTAEPEVASRADSPGGPSGVPPYRYTAALANDIERRWQDHWESADTFAVANPGPGHPAPAGEKFYLMDMFPYPSGAGLHVGHPLGFIGTDVLGRLLRMSGRTVLHTMGFDAFGLPAEQYAVQTGTHPRTTTEANIARYRAQIRQLGLAHDQHRSVSTTDVDFYRWTQWIFLRIHGSWYDTEVGRARPITELVTSSRRASGPCPTGVTGARCPARSRTASSTTTGWPISPTRPSTGAPRWARCSPTRRSPPTAVPSAATSPCSAATCANG